MRYLQFILLTLLLINQHQIYFANGYHNDRNDYHDNYHNGNGNGYFLQLTDIHLDLGYTIGSPGNCKMGEKVGIGCCRSWSIPQKPYEKADPWGNHNCDQSPHFFNRTLNWLSRQLVNDQLPQLDFIIVTGDLANHHDITQTPWGNLKVIELVSQQLKATFPQIPVYFCLGNHDTYPVDQLPLPPANSWLTNKLARFWSPWLEPQALETLAHGGYWGQNIAESKTRLIALNSIYFDDDNFFRGNPDKDPAGQWKWLENLLAQSETRGQAVWIMGHIPPKVGESTKWFSSHYTQLLHRYHRTIKGQFFGHTHSDSFFVLADDSGNQKVFSQGYVAPCLEALGRQPSFRIYGYNRSSAEISDYWQYRANLSQIIQQDRLEYRLYYRAKQAYHKYLPDLSPQSWANLYKHLQTNQTLFNQFYQRYATGYKVETCDNACRKGLLSQMNLGGA